MCSSVAAVRAELRGLCHLSVDKIDVSLCGRFAEITIGVRRAFCFRCFEGLSRYVYALDLDARPATVLALSIGLHMVEQER